MPIKYIQIVIFLLFSFVTVAQDGLNLRLTTETATTSEAIYVQDNYAYVMSNSFDTTRIVNLLGVLFIVDLDKQEIVDSIVINTYPVKFDVRSNMIYAENDTLHYFAYGNEWRDTIINDQNTYSHYHHFKFNMNDKTWTNNTFPAYNEIGQQLIQHIDNYFFDTSIYLAGLRYDFDTSEADILITKMNHAGNVIWNHKYYNELPYSIWGIIIDKNEDVIVSGIKAYQHRWNGFRHLYIYKLDANDGKVIKKYVSEELFNMPRALIEDPNGGYIIGADSPLFQEGDKYPAFAQIVKLDENLDSIKWRLILSDTISYTEWHFDEIISIGNNEFIAVGVSDMITPFEHIGRIVKFTGDGELIFDKEIHNLKFSEDAEQRLTDVVAYKDGYLACGTILARTDTLISPRQQGWIVYFDKDGNNDINSSTEIISVDRGVFKLYPNPSRDRVSIEFDEAVIETSTYQILSGDGKLIQNGVFTKGTKQEEIRFQNIKSGMYVFRLKQKSGFVTKLLVVE